MQLQSVRGWFKGAAAWIVTVMSMSLTFGVSINVERLVTDTFPNYPGANFLDEIIGWAMISGFFIAMASLLFALPALSLTRALGTLSFARIVALGAVTGPISACLLAAPMIAETSAGWAEFAFLGLACGTVGAVAWWFLYERSRSRSMRAA